MRPIKIVALTLALGAFAAPCFGWGHQGHEIVGAIALKRLTPEAKAGVVELLGNDNLSAAGCWADEIRSNKAYDWVKPLHYVNAPRNATAIDPKRDCSAEGCVVEAIERYTAVVKDASKPKDQRAEALKLLIHFIGDVHQPLHVSYADDRGGNSVKVKAFGKDGGNLHAVWDATLIEHKSGGNWAKLADEINAAITPAQAASWSASKTPLSWANESLALTRHIYAELPATKGELGQAYYDRNIGTIQERLAAGGVRLATSLNAIFAAPPASKAAAVGDGWKQTFTVDKANLRPDCTNPYFDLTPGRVHVYREGETTLTIRVLDETKLVDGVTTRVVEEREEEAGKPKEISRNYFAADRTNGDVYYFGEDVDVYAEGQITHPGVWLSGANGAHFGLMLPGKPKVGDRYYQELAPGVAMDRFEVLADDAAIETPAGKFEHCIRIRETSSLESDIGYKLYAPGVGLVKDGSAELVFRK